MTLFNAPRFRGLHNIYLEFLSGNQRLVIRMFLNYVWAFFRIPFLVPSPVELQVEPSAVCNLKCEMCIIPKTTVMSSAILKKENFLKLLKQLSPLRSINFTGIGESLINPELEDYIFESTKRGIKTLFISNGQLLNSQRVEKIINSGVDSVCFSIESGEPETYSKIRRGADYTKLEANISLFTKIIKEQNASIQVSLNTVLLKETLEAPQHLFKIIDFAERVGVNLLTTQNPHDIDAYGLKAYYEEHKGDLENIFKSLEVYAGQHHVKITFPTITVGKGSCYYPWVYPQLTADGELLPCCLIAQFIGVDKAVEDYSYGNVFRSGFHAVWNGKRAVAFRSRLSSAQPYDFCQKCSKYRGIL